MIKQETTKPSTRKRSTRKNTTISVIQFANLFGISRQRAYVVLNDDKNKLPSKMMSVLMMFDEETLKEKIEKATSL